MWVSREIWLWKKKRDIFFSTQKFRPVQINFLVILFTCEWMFLRSFFQWRYEPHTGFWRICVCIVQIFTLHGLKVLAFVSVRPWRPAHWLLSSAQSLRFYINPQGYASFSCKLSIYEDIYRLYSTFFGVFR